MAATNYTPISLYYSSTTTNVPLAGNLVNGELAINITDGAGGTIEAIAFGAFDTALGPRLLDHGGARFHVAGRLEVNTWADARARNCDWRTRQRPDPRHK